MKYLAIALLISVTTSFSQDSWQGHKLKLDTLKVPGLTVWKDSTGQPYTRIMLLPQADGSFVTEAGQYLIPIPIESLTIERLDFVKAQVNLWRAETALKKADKK